MITSKRLDDVRARLSADRTRRDDGYRRELAEGGRNCTAFGFPLTPSLAREWAEVYPSVPDRWRRHFDTPARLFGLPPDRETV